MTPSTKETGRRTQPIIRAPGTQAKMTPTIATMRAIRPSVFLRGGGGGGGVWGGAKLVGGCRPGSGNGIFELMKIPIVGTCGYTGTLLTCNDVFIVHLGAVADRSMERWV
ncbi:hypothetical protein GCM10010407_04330 [Rarobacter incanus]